MTAVQVPASHYAFASYVTRGRWSSYWHQLSEVLALGPRDVLLVGKGDGVVEDSLVRAGVAVTTCDVAADLDPDVVGDVRALPFAERSFDAVLCAQVLEHLPFADVPRALDELARVVRIGVVVSVPQYGRAWQLVLRLPFLPALRGSGTFPARTAHAFDGQHHWELGARNFPRARFERELRARFGVERSFAVPDHPYQRFYVLRPLGIA